MGGRTLPINAAVSLRDRVPEPRLHLEGLKKDDQDPRLDGWPGI
jgi:hypothetical protein